jgi:hypothetical protein
MLIRVVLFLLLLTTSAYAAAPTYDNAASTFGDTVTSLSLTGFTTTGSDRLLTSCIAQNSVIASPITSHAYNTSETMTLVETADWGNDSASILYRRIAPSSGSHDLDVSFDDSVTASLGAISFAGAHQTVPLGTAVKHTGLLEAEATVTVTSATDEIVFDCFGYGAATVPSNGGGQTERWDEDQAFTVANGTTEAGAGSVVMNRTWASSFTSTGLIGVGVKPVATATGRRAVIVE